MQNKEVFLGIMGMFDESSKKALILQGFLH